MRLARQPRAWLASSLALIPRAPRRGARWTSDPALPTRWPPSPSCSPRTVGGRAVARCGDRRLARHHAAPPISRACLLDRPGLTVRVRCGPYRGVRARPEAEQLGPARRNNFPRIWSSAPRRRSGSRVGVAGTPLPATQSSSLTAADPGGSAQDRALLARLERPEGTAAVVERHLLTTGRRVRRAVLPVSPGAGARRVVVALLQGRLRAVDRPEGCDRHAGGVLETLEIARCRRTLQLRIRAHMGAVAKARVARGERAGKSERPVVVEASEGGGQSALEDHPARRQRGRRGRDGGTGVRDARAWADAEPAGVAALARRSDEASVGRRGHAALDGGGTGVWDARAWADAEPAGVAALARRSDETSVGRRGHAALDRRQARRRRGGHRRGGADGRPRGGRGRYGGERRRRRARRRGGARTHPWQALQDVGVAILQWLRSLHRLSEPGDLKDAGTLLALLADLDGQVGGERVVALVAEKTAGRAHGERGRVRLELEFLEATWRHAISHAWLIDAELHLQSAHVVAQAVRVAPGIAVSAL